MAERMRLLRAHFAGRIDPFASAIFVFPLFLLYQLGILFGARGRNGVDYLTDLLIRLCDRDPVLFVQLLVAMTGAYLLALAWLRRKGHLHPGAFVPVLVESTVYAFFMGAVITALMARFFDFLPGVAIVQAGFVDVLVISAGAGFHEELIFRAGLFMALIRVFDTPLPTWLAMPAALVVSSMVFALAHHVGGAAEPFTLVAFVYRSLAGVIFGLLHYHRGFAVAVWTHALYDVFVLSSAG